MGTYVVGDIHGRYYEWLKLKDNILEEDKNAQFILVGDIIDRGANTYEMCKWAMENITEDGQYQMVIGNHEDEKVNWLKNNIAYIKEIQDTYTAVDIITIYPERYDLYSQLYKYIQDKAKTCTFEVNFLSWCSKLPYYKDIVVNNKRFIIAHANIPYSIINEKTGALKSRADLTMKERQFIVWDRDVIGFDKIENTILVHGHTPTIMHDAFSYKSSLNSDNYGKIFHTHNRYNVDCGITYKEADDRARLAALRLDDFKEYYVQ